MTIVALAWLYVVVMMAVAEALSTQGTLLGAFFTLLLYGVMPLGVVLYIMGTPARRRARARSEAPNSHPPDGSSVPSGDAVAAEREKP